jgi:hypothetical protein
MENNPPYAISIHCSLKEAKYMKPMFEVTPEQRLIMMHLLMNSKARIKRNRALLEAAERECEKRRKLGEFSSWQLRTKEYGN